MYCGQCGQKVGNESAFCCNCGSPIAAGKPAATQTSAAFPSDNNPPVTDPPPNAAGRKGSVLNNKVAIGGAVAVVLLLIGGFMAALGPGPTFIKQINDQENSLADTQVIAKQASVVRTEKDVYDQGEVIRVHFSNAPGYSSDWICIVRAGSPDSAAGNYKYLPRGVSAGTLSFNPPTPGAYEARAYYNYRHGGYRVSGRYAFQVISDTRR